MLTIAELNACSLAQIIADPTKSDLLGELLTVRFATPGTDTRVSVSGSDGEVIQAGAIVITATCAGETLWVWEQPINTSGGTGGNSVSAMVAAIARSVPHVHVNL